MRIIERILKISAIIDKWIVNVVEEKSVLFHKTETSFKF